MMHPPHVMRIEPSFYAPVGSKSMFASIAPGKRERNDYHDREAHYQANH